MDELIAFLRAQLDEDERVALAASGFYDDRDLSAELVEEGFDREVGDLAAYWDPARVLAEVEAKRRILGEHRPVEAGDVPGLAMCFVDNEVMPCDHVRWLAQPYAGREGWREEWRA
jgi:hypothetical protein